MLHHILCNINLQENLLHAKGRISRQVSRFNRLNKLFWLFKALLATDLVHLLHFLQYSILHTGCLADHSVICYL